MQQDNQQGSTTDEEHTHDEARWHEATGFADLARGVRVFIGPGGATREEPIE